MRISMQKTTCYLLTMLLTVNTLESQIRNDFNNNILNQKTESQKTNPLTNLGDNIVKSYSGWNALYHIGGISLTYIIVNSNLDASMLRATSKMNHATSERVGFPGIMTGYITPVLLPSAMFCIAGKNNDDLRNASYAVMQSVGIAVVSNSLLKSITGRVPPDPDNSDKKKLSRQFRFGFLKGGMHYGWPSGHLMTNMAMVSSLIAYYPGKTWLKTVSFVYISYLAASVLIDERGRAHWLSEVVAGSLMGYAIGSTVGGHFNKYRLHRNTASKQNRNASLQWYPCIGRDYNGLALNVNF
jgi:hypothetical protein